MTTIQERNKAIARASAEIEWGGKVGSFSQPMFFPPHQVTELTVKYDTDTYIRRAVWVLGFKVYDKNWITP